MTGAAIPFTLDAVYPSRDDLKAAAQAKASQDQTKLRVYISQPGRVDRARIYLGCSANGIRAGASQCTYRIHATEYDGKWQVTKADFHHSHAFADDQADIPDVERPHMYVGQEFGTQEDFQRLAERRAAFDKVDLRVFVNLGKLARRARFAMCCSFGSKANASKGERCTYSFIAIDYEGQWQVTQCCFTHSHPPQPNPQIPIGPPYYPANFGQPEFLPMPVRAYPPMRERPPIDRRRVRSQKDTRISPLRPGILFGPSSALMPADYDSPSQPNFDFRDPLQRQPSGSPVSDASWSSPYSLPADVGSETSDHNQRHIQPRLLPDRTDLNAFQPDPAQQDILGPAVTQNESGIVTRARAPTLRELLTE